MVRKNRNRVRAFVYMIGLGIMFAVFLTAIVYGDYMKSAPSNFYRIGALIVVVALFFFIFACLIQIIFGVTIYRPSGREKIKNLIIDLKDEKESYRSEAAHALRSYEEKQAVSFLIETLNDTSEDVRYETFCALRHITNQGFDNDPIKWKEWWETVKHNKEYEPFKFKD